MSRKKHEHWIRVSTAIVTSVKKNLWQDSNQMLESLTCSCSLDLSSFPPSISSFVSIYSWKMPMERRTPRSSHWNILGSGWSGSSLLATGWLWDSLFSEKQSSEAAWEEIERGQNLSKSAGSVRGHHLPAGPVWRKENVHGEQRRRVQGKESSLIKKKAGSNSEGFILSCWTFSQLSWWKFLWFRVDWRRWQRRRKSVKEAQER